MRNPLPPLSVVPVERRHRVGAMAVLVAVGLLSSATPNAAPYTDRCAPPAAKEPYLTLQDFHWEYSPAELHARFDEVYSGYRRLHHRASRDTVNGGYALPFRSYFAVGEVALSVDVVATIRDHVETALARDVADHVFMPDMGHAHFLVSELLYEERVRDLPVSRMPEAYELMLADPTTLFVYHTAEQLRMIDDANHSIDDPYLRHRLATRSLVGGREKGSLRVAVAPDSLLNVVRGGMPGYRWWGAGFVLSANRFACFPFDDRGTTRWFDLSLHDLPATHGMSDFDLGPRRSTSTTLAFDWEAPTPRATLHGPVSKQIP